jgi:hypothetical protein
VQESKTDDGLVDLDNLIKKMLDSSDEHVKQNADAVRKKLKNHLSDERPDRRRVLDETALIGALQLGMQEAIDKAKSPRNSLKKDM